jgi:uroporphyrin-III C-methyltransferase
LARGGKVYLVGAGPGPPELLTLKAAELLKAADVIIYDRLIQEQVLAFAKPTVERIYMGKPLGKHDSRQEEINNLLVQEANEGKLVIRLKGGDPFLFGRGGEEVEFLAEHQVPFEVVPGVSSALAAPLSAGIAVTHRDAASAVAIVTGHEATKNAGRMDWATLSRIDTLVFLMVVHNIGRVSQELINHGRDPATPAAIIQMAFWPEQKVVTGTLANIAEEAARSGIGPPATLVVGEVVRLREKLNGFGHGLKLLEANLSHPPGPMPDQVLRLAVGGLGSQLLGFALSMRLFDRMEEPQSAASLGQELGLEPARLGEILDCLVALGLLEHVSGGYRNLELASNYLRTDSPQSLRPVLLCQLGRFSQWEDVSAYAFNGHARRVPPAGQDLHRSWWENLASLAALAIVNQMDLAEHSRVLVSGWGREAIRKVFSHRWRHLILDDGDFLQTPAPLSLLREGSFDAIVLSGVLPCHAREHVREILAASAQALNERGVLVMHDAFAPTSSTPSPETVLEALGRHIAWGADANWSVEQLRTALQAARFGYVHQAPLAAGTMVVTARKDPNHSAER